jgi:hypothetical protein
MQWNFELHTCYTKSRNYSEPVTIHIASDTLQQERLIYAKAQENSPTWERNSCLPSHENIIFCSPNLLPSFRVCY